MRRRDFVLALSAVALAACSPAGQEAETPDAGRAITDPAAVIRPLYDPYIAHAEQFPSFRDQAPWSNELWTQLEAMMQRSETINEPILDFDPLIGAQDYEIANLNVSTEALAEASHAVVRASFDNLGQRTEIVYDMVWEDDRWKVNNIRGDGWDLRQIATAPSADAIPG